MPNAPGSGIPTNPGAAGGGITDSAGKTILNPSDTTAAHRKTAADNGQGDISQPNINGQQPPALKTLVYSPDVRVVIAHGAKQYDVSTDIVRCSLHRAESSAASFFMTVSNKGLRYTPKTGKPMFSRMDRIVVYMKRTEMRQVFSGYLDTVPYKQLYPGTVNFKATCTVKRLMHTWWNPALAQSSQLLDQMSTSTGISGDGQNGNDSGLGSMLRRILVLVGGWKVENIHIQNFPTLFFEFLKSQASKNQKVNDEAVNKFETLLLGSDHSPAPGAQAGHNPNAGPPGPSSIGAGAAGPVGAGTTFYVQQIIAACDERGLGPLVSDNNLSAGLAQAGETGQNGMSPSQQKAWQQVQQTNLDAQQANRNSDAAIIGTAVAIVETGPTIRNLYNPAVPGSEKFPNDGPGTNGTSVGIFQQQNFSEWGDVSQRMNPKQAAGMFFEHLARMVPNWRNIDPADAAQQVQRSAGAPYAGAMPLATKLVQAQRQSSSGATSTVTGGLIGGGAAGTSAPGPINAPSGTGAAPNTNPNLTPAVPSIGPGAAGVPGLPSPTSSVKPHPDSEGAVQFMLSKCGNTPYVWGGKGPSSYDCSGLVSAAFSSIGINVPSQTNSIRAAVQQIPKSQAGRGDIYEPHSNHVGLLLGPPGTQFVSAATSGVPLPQQIRVEPWYSGTSEWYGRVCLNGGPDATSPYNPASMGGSGSGAMPGALDQQGGTGTPAGSSGSDEGIARNLFSYIFTPGQFSADVASYLPGEKAFIDGQPLIQIVQAIAGASLRKFQSAPNGDLMFYYPDWWGLDGKPAVYRLEDIELKDVRIDFSDDNLTTHVYVEGDYSMLGQSEQMLAWLDTAGVATVEDTWLYQRLIKMAPGDPETASGEELMRRYGIRPLKQTYAMAGTHELEFLLAAQIFMEKWAQQFQTAISMTFMPELLPGMRIELAGHNLSVYVTEVTHICDFEQGFSTEAVIMAPANPNGKTLMSTVKSTVNQGLIQSDAGQAFTDPLGGANTTIAAATGGGG